MRHMMLLFMGAALLTTGCLLPERKSGREAMLEDMEDILEDFTPGPHVKEVDGDRGRITFAPEGCSSEKPVCDDGLRLAVGYDGSVHFDVPPMLGSEVALESSDPSVIEVSQGGAYHEHLARVVARAPGTAALIVRELDGPEVDRLTLEVRPFGGLFWRLQDPGDGEIVGDGIALPQGQDVVLFIDVVGEDDELLMAPIAWDMIEGDDFASITGFDNRFDFNYENTIMGRKPGHAVIELSTLGGTVTIPVEVRE